MTQMTTQAACDLAQQYYQAGHLAEAEQICRQIVDQEPGDFRALHLLGVITYKMEKIDVALELFRKCVAIDPSNPEAYSNLGNAHRRRGELGECIAAYQKAIALKPDFAEVYSNLGNVLPATGQVEQAIGAYRKAIELKYNFPEAHLNLGLMLLLTGDFEAGWAEYEWRFLLEDSTYARSRFPQEKWDGSPLRGRTIFLHGEQGLGDAIQFFRYLPMVKALGGQVIMGCRPELVRLLQSMAGDIPFITQGSRLPQFDVHCPLMSLPKVLGTNLGNIPQTVPYIQPATADVEKWRSRLAEYASSLKVGLAWAGSPVHMNDRHRSMPGHVLAPLARVPGVRFFNLQKEKVAQTPPHGLELIDLMPEMNDFADTAGLVANLDLMIAVDTAIVHLAGAMGRPVWTMISLSPDWRWLLNRQDSPWYPTMHLFRQTRMDEWDNVIEEVTRALSTLVGQRVDTASAG